MLSIQIQRASILHWFHRPWKTFSTRFHLFILHIFSKLIYAKINNSKLPMFLKMRLKKEKQEIFQISLNDLSLWKHSTTYFVH